MKINFSIFVCFICGICAQHACGMETWYTHHTSARTIRWVDPAQNCFDTHINPCIEKADEACSSCSFAIFEWVMNKLEARHHAETARRLRAAMLAQPEHTEHMQR